MCSRQPYDQSMTRLSVSLDGGIGNLLFQYSAALTLHNQFNCNVGFKEISPGLLARLEKYVGETDSFSVSRYSESHSLLKSKISRLTTKWVPDFSPCAMPYSNRVKLLKGYFQHPSWYDESIGLVLEKLATNRQLASKSIPNNLTAIHLRRSDYVRLGWDLPMSYYEKALTIDNGINRGPIAIFSDDKIVSHLFEQRLFAAGLTIYQDEQVSERTAFHDFFTIANAKTVIMSNSTFCWWAVKLAQHSEKDVVAYCPSTWLPDQKSNVLIDTKWLKV